VSKKVELSDDITLYCGDCREILPLEADALVSDVPYGIGLPTNYKARKRGPLAGANDYQPIVGDDKPFDPKHLLNYPVVVLFGANFFADKLPISGGWIVWDKLNGLKSKRKYGFCDNSDCELIWTNVGSAVRLLQHRWMGMLKDSERREKRNHPTQKPVQLLMDILEMKTKPGDVVLDPYMGTGSTGRACVRTGRKFIGIEIDEDYFNIAVRCIKEEQLQTTMELI